jgi:RNA polymerase sigma-70 factor (ECF subfamily)
MGRSRESGRARVETGRASAFEELGRRALELRGDLVRRIERQCRDVHEAEDVVQEALMRALRSLRERSDEVELRPWLMRVAKSVLYDRARREGRRSAMVCDLAVDETPAPEPEPSEVLEGPDLLVIDGRVVPQRVATRAVQSGLDRLRTSDRELLIDHYHRGLGCSELAARDGVRAEAVKVRLFRARRRLAGVLERTLVAEPRREGRR